MTLYQQGTRSWIDAARTRDDDAPTNVHLDLLAGGHLLRRPRRGIKVALPQRFVARLEPSQEFVQDLVAVDRPTGHLAQTCHAGLQFSGEVRGRPIDVDADAH